MESQELVIQNIIANFQVERSTLDILEISCWQNECTNSLLEKIDAIAALVSSRVSNSVDPQAIDLVNQIWSPRLEWKIAHIPEFNAITASNAVTKYGIAIRTYISLKTSLDDILNQYTDAINKVADRLPHRLIKCRDDVFLRQFYERIYQDVNDPAKQNQIKEFIEHRFDVEFLDYSIENYSKGYFDTHHANSDEKTTALALINKQDGSVIHKGDHVIPNN